MKQKGMTRNSVYNRVEIKKLFPSHRYEMRDFWAICPYSSKEIASSSRKREHIIYRNVGVVWAWLSGLTLRESGEMFGRGHCMTIHAIKEIKKAFEDGYGHIEMIDVVNQMRDNSFIFEHQTGDVHMDEIRSLVSLENLIAERL